MLNPPHPEFDTGLGFCYFLDDAHYRSVDLQSWLPELKALGASWLTILASPARAIPEAFIRGLVAEGIEPLIQIPVPVSQSLDLGILETLFKSYAAWGAHYVAVYDKPNLKANWNPSDWAQPDLVGRFVDLLLPILALEDRAGLTPVFPALQQGGDFWDTSFLDLALNHLTTHDRLGLLDRLVFAHYAFAFNRPIAWGAGGQARWSQTQPYNAPPNSQDQRGFRAFEWYAEVIRARLGHDQPLLMLSGGCRMGDSTDPHFGAVDENGHATCNAEIMQAMMNRQLPAYLLNVAFYLLAAPADPTLQQFAWFRSDGSTLPAVGAFKQLVAQATGALAAAEKSLHSAGAPLQPAAGPRPLFHYLLLPTFEWGVSNWHWTAVVEYVNRFQPACGFSAQEARAAVYVTIIGNQQGVGPGPEQELRDAGCCVERVCGRDGQETQLLLNEMARTGRRFQTTAGLSPQPSTA